MWAWHNIRYYCFIQHNEHLRNNEQIIKNIRLWFSPKADIIAANNVMQTYNDKRKQVKHHLQEKLKQLQQTQCRKKWSPSSSTLTWTLISWWMAWRSFAYINTCRQLKKWVLQGLRRNAEESMQRSREFFRNLALLSSI